MPHLYTAPNGQDATPAQARRAILALAKICRRVADTNTDLPPWQRQKYVDAAKMAERWQSVAAAPRIWKRLEEFALGS